MANYVDIACLGDSISNGYYDDTGKGWVVRLVEKLNERKPCGYYLNNFARSGDRSCDALHKLCHSVIPAESNILFIAIGANDILRWDSPENPTNMTRPMQEEYWTRILETAKKNIDRTYVFGLIPSDETKMPETGYNDRPLWYLNTDIVDYNIFLEKICRTHGIPFLNPYDGFSATGGANLLRDGSHPTAQGHEWMATNAFGLLKDQI